MKTKSAALLAVCCVVLPSMPFGAKVWAAPQDGPLEVQPLAAAIADDLKQSALDLGLSEDEAAAYAQGQETFAQAAGAIKARWPESYVDAEWDGPNSARTAIHVHRDVMVDALKMAGANARYIKASDGLSEEVRASLEKELIDRAVARTNGVHPVTASVDANMREGFVSIEAGDADRSRVSSSLGEVLQSSSPYLTSVSVQYTNQSTQSEYGSGGNWNGKQCTAGFTASRAGKAAISGTAHCGSASAYDGAKLSGRMVSTAAQGDVQSFIATGGTRTNLVRYDWNKSRAIRIAFDPVKGNVVCHFGISSGQKCSTVNAVGKSSYFPDLKKTVGSLVFVKDNVSARGDSGGPWFWSNRAHGIHMGNCGGVSCFSPVSSLLTIGTVVYTGQ